MSAPTPTLPITSSQTIGPFPHEGWRWAFDTGNPAHPLQLSGRVFDGDGQPVSDAVLEAWVPGERAGTPVPGLTGLYRTHTDDAGAFRLALPDHGLPGEPLCYVVVFARGLLKHQFTAVFPAACDDAPLLGQVPSARRATLVATAEGAGLRWDLHLQGPGETVFFDFT